MSRKGIRVRKLSLAGLGESQVQELDPLCSDLKTITDPSVELDEYFEGRGPWEKQPMDWWYIDSKERSFLDSADDSEDEREEEASVSNTSGQTDDNETKPAWHPDQWYTRLHQ